MKKIGRKAAKIKKKVGQKHYKKRIPAFRIAHFLKKKKSIALSVLGKSSWDKPFFFFFFFCQKKIIPNLYRQTERFLR